MLVPGPDAAMFVPGPDANKSPVKEEQCSNEEGIQTPVKQHTSTQEEGRETEVKQDACSTQYDRTLLIDESQNECSSYDKEQPEKPKKSK